MSATPPTANIAKKRPRATAGPTTFAETPSQHVMRQILFIQGGGEGAHDEWDDKLVASLEQALGAAGAIRYPRMPDEQNPSSATWSPTIRREIESLGHGAVVVGHSVGGTLLVRALMDQGHRTALAGIVLIGAPFVGADGWPGTEFEFSTGLGARLPARVPIHVFHGLGDSTVPPSHARLYGAAIAQAQLHLLPERDHQLNNDLREVAAALSAFE
jgi:predicted alpha/beta hydrolase family esterase